MCDTYVVVCGRYKLGKKLFSNSRYAFLEGFNLHTNEKVFIKAEERQGRYSYEMNLFKDCKAMQVLQGGPGVPSLHWCGQDDDFNFLIMEHLSNHNLEQVMATKNKTLTLDTVLQVGARTLQSLQFLHVKGMVFNNVNPDHILAGSGSNNHKLYLVDYSLVSEYKDSKSGQHIPLTNKGLTPSNIGFSSVSVNSGNSPSRRDDIQSWFYLIVYLLKGSLPWLQKQLQNIQDLLYIKKESLKAQKLLVGLPVQLKTVFRYVKTIKHQQTPDYQYIRDMLKLLASQQGLILGNIYDWNIHPTQPLTDPKEHQVRINIQTISQQTRFMQQQFNLYTFQMKESANISRLLGDTLVDQSPVENQCEEYSRYITSQKQNCLLF